MLDKVFQLLETTFRLLYITKISLNGLFFAKKVIIIDEDETKKASDKRIENAGKASNAFRKAKNLTSKSLDFLLSPGITRIISVMSAAMIIVSGPFIWPVGVAMLSCTIIAIGITLSIETVRLRNLQRSQLEIAVLKELNKQPNKAKELLLTDEFNCLKLTHDDFKERKLSVFKAIKKEIGNSLCENTVSLTLSILNGNAVFLIINIIGTVSSFAHNSKIRAINDKLYIQQKNESDKLKFSLGLEIDTKDIGKLNALYEKVTGNEFKHEIPTLKKAFTSIVMNSFSAKRSVNQYIAINNNYLDKESKENVPEKEMQNNKERSIDKEKNSLSTAQQSTYSNEVMMKKIIKKSHQDTQYMRK